MSFREPTKQQDNVLEHGYASKGPMMGHPYTPEQIEEFKKFQAQARAAADAMRLANNGRPVR
jgi:hypothetical protein